MLCVVVALFTSSTALLSKPGSDTTRLVGFWHRYCYPDNTLAKNVVNNLVGQGDQAIKLALEFNVLPNNTRSGRWDGEIVYLRMRGCDLGVGDFTSYRRSPNFEEMPLVFLNQTAPDSVDLYTLSFGKKQIPRFRLESEADKNSTIDTVAIAGSCRHYLTSDRSLIKRDRCWPSSRVKCPLEWGFYLENRPTPVKVPVIASEYASEAHVAHHPSYPKPSVTIHAVSRILHCTEFLDLLKTVSISTPSVNQMLKARISAYVEMVKTLSDGSKEESFSVPVLTQVSGPSSSVTTIELAQPQFHKTLRTFSPGSFSDGLFLVDNIFVSSYYFNELGSNLYDRFIGKYSSSSSFHRYGEQLFIHNTLGSIVSSANRLVKETTTDSRLEVLKRNIILDSLIEDTLSLYSQTLKQFARSVGHFCDFVGSFDTRSYGYDGHLLLKSQVGPGVNPSKDSSLYFGIHDSPGLTESQKNNFAKLLSTAIRSSPGKSIGEYIPYQHLFDRNMIGDCIHTLKKDTRYCNDIIIKYLSSLNVTGFNLANIHKNLDFSVNDLHAQFDNPIGKVWLFSGLDRHANNRVLNMFAQLVNDDKGYLQMDEDDVVDTMIARYSQRYANLADEADDSDFDDSVEIYQSAFEAGTFAADIAEMSSSPFYLFDVDYRSNITAVKTKIDSILVIVDSTLRAAHYRLLSSRQELKEAYRLRKYIAESSREESQITFSTDSTRWAYWPKSNFLGESASDMVNAVESFKVSQGYDRKYSPMSDKSYKRLLSSIPTFSKLKGTSFAVSLTQQRPKFSILFSLDIDGNFDRSDNYYGALVCSGSKLIEATSSTSEHMDFRGPYRIHLLQDQPWSLVDGCELFMIASPRDSEAGLPVNVEALYYIPSKNQGK
jgi:hypothetical protein